MLFVNIYVCLIAFGAHYAHGDDLSDKAEISNNFVYVLKREMFFNLSSDAKTAVQFIPSLADKPDLPGWLNFVQADQHRNGYLFGTPHTPGQSAQLEILGINKDTYDTNIHTLEIKVFPRNVVATYFMELRFKNFNLDEILSSNHLDILLRKVKSLWLRSDDVYITKIRSLLEIGERIPIPDEPGMPPGKEGVLVQFGGTADFSTDLKAVEIEIKSPECQPTGNRHPDVRIKSFFSPQYDVDWCKYRLISPDMIEKPSPPPGPQPIDLNLSHMTLEPYNIPRRMLRDDFIVTVVSSSVLALVFFVLLSYLMFGCREGLEKRNRMTPDSQMKQFASIRRATNNLRYMSVRRDVPPPPLGVTSFSPSEEGSEDVSIQGSPRRVGSFTDSRGHPPPPYRLPPSYPIDTELSYVPENTHPKERVCFAPNDENGKSLQHLLDSPERQYDLMPTSSSC